MYLPSTDLSYGLLNVRIVETHRELNDVVMTQVIAAYAILTGVANDVVLYMKLNDYTRLWRARVGLGRDIRFSCTHVELIYQESKASLADCSFINQSTARI